MPAKCVNKLDRNMCYIIFSINIQCREERTLIVEVFKNISQRAQVYVYILRFLMKSVLCLDIDYVWLVITTVES